MKTKKEKQVKRWQKEYRELMARQKKSIIYK